MFNIMIVVITNKYLGLPPWLGLTYHIVFSILLIDYVRDLVVGRRSCSLLVAKRYL